MGREIIIYGRVQGVGFRNRIKEFCLENHLKGFVRNLSDGSVYVYLDAKEKEVELFLNWIKEIKGFVKINNFELREKNFKSEGFIVKKDKGFLRDKLESEINLLRYFFGLSFPRNYLRKIPQHVVIIPDGNRRWAKRRGMNESEGHKKSAQFGNVKSLLKECSDLGVKSFSIWGFSTENWKRSEEEKKILFDLIYSTLEKFHKEISKNKIRFRHFGRKDRLPSKLVELIKKLEKESAKNNEFNFNLLLDYGGRDEIIRSIEKLLNAKKKKISEEEFSKYLDSYGVEDPDLIIRTSGEKRISGLMPWQTVYSELYFCDKFFPSFNKNDLRKAVFEYDGRERRLGK